MKAPLRDVNTDRRAGSDVPLRTAAENAVAFSPPLPRPGRSFQPVGSAAKDVRERSMKQTARQWCIQDRDEWTRVKELGGGCDEILQHFRPSSGFHDLTLEGNPVDYRTLASKSARPGIPASFGRGQRFARAKPLSKYKQVENRAGSSFDGRDSHRRQYQTRPIKREVMLQVTGRSTLCHGPAKPSRVGSCLLCYPVPDK